VTASGGHIPVLGDEVVRALPFGRAAFVVDGTVGLGGHTEKLLRSYPDMRILGLDWDAQALQIAQDRLAPFGDRFEGVEANYADLPSILSQRGRGTIDGILLDLGLSSLQLQDSDRGFSFLRPGPMDMRMSRSLTHTAWQILSQSNERELAHIFRIYGEETQARRIARALKDALKKKTLPNDAWQVAEAIRKTVGSPWHRIDPATRCFQALRMAVNRELPNLDTALGYLEQVLAAGGRAVFISFHSLEDRRVKAAFQRAAKGCVCPPQVPQCVCGKTPWGTLVTRKVITASPAEVERNPRARSAKMRILERL
jgi:16S rRNA (cytosine1402-N4)-methyltransferase